MTLRFIRRPGIILLMMILIHSIANSPILAQDESPLDDSTNTDTLRIALREAIFMALERNPSISIQRLEPQVAKTYISEELGFYEPTLAVAATRNKSKIQRFLGSRPDPFEMTSERYQYDLSLSQQLPFGTTITPNAFISGSLSSIYSDQYSGGLGLSITQALLKGFGFGANLASLRRARLDWEISNAELKAFAENLVANVENAYWSLFLAEQEIDIQQKSLQLAEKQLQESEERRLVGKLPDLELAAVHAEVSTRKEALIDAQSSYEQARLQFLFLLNPTEQTNWTTCLIPMDHPFVPADTLAPISIHDSLGFKYRADLQQARLSLRKGELEIARTKNGLLPRLDLFVSLGRTSFSKSYREGLPDIHSPFYDISLGLNFEFPVTDQSARAQYRRSIYTRDQLELSIRNLERMVQLDVRSSYIEVLRTKQQIEATRITRELQDKKLQAEHEKFRVGKSTNFLVLQAQRDFVASQLDEARSMVAHLNALVDLYLMEGTLLERRGIENGECGVRNSE